MLERECSPENDYRFHRRQVPPIQTTKKVVISKMMMIVAEVQKLTLGRM